MDAGVGHGPAYRSAALPPGSAQLTGWLGRSSACPVYYLPAMAVDQGEHDHPRVSSSADLKGYTDFVEQRGAAAAAELLTQYRALAREAIGEFGGAEIKTEGDSFYVVFDSVSSAVRCGLAITTAASAATDQPIRVGVGIHAGETIEADGGYVGSPVNIAARICAQAGPGQVRVSQSVRALTTTVLPFQFKSARPTSAEGHRRADRAVRGSGGGRRGDRMAVERSSTALAAGACRYRRWRGACGGRLRGWRLAGAPPVHGAPTGALDDRRAHAAEWPLARCIGGHRCPQRRAACHRPDERGRPPRRRGVGLEGIRHTQRRSISGRRRRTRHDRRSSNDCRRRPVHVS